MKKGGVSDESIAGRTVFIFSAVCAA